MKRQIGLDFGTTTTVVVYRDHDNTNPGDAKPVIFDGVNYVPTLILMDGYVTSKKGISTHHDAAFGREAENAHKFHSLLKRNFKMGLISKDPAVRKEAQALTKDFFVYLYKNYDAKALEKKDSPIESISTWVTYPAKFPSDVQNFLKEAAEEAGFRNVRLLDESKAAMAFSLTYDTGRIRNYVQSLPKSKVNVLLIDMGAGTTDIAVFRYDKDDPVAFEHLCSWPKNGAVNFGGREIDEKLCRFYKEKLGKDAIVEELFRNDPEVAEKLLEKLVKAFKDGTLSPMLAENKTVDLLPGDLENIADDMDEDPHTDLNRGTFEALLKDYLPQFPVLVTGALEEAGMSGKDVDMVILTGGHSQWYFVEDQLAALGIAKKAIFTFSDPHMVVAQGAAWYTEPKKKPIPVSDPKPDPKPTPKPKPKSIPKPTQDTLSDSIIVRLNASLGNEYIKLMLIPLNSDLPVKLEWMNRAFFRMFRPDSVQWDPQKDAKRMIVTGYKEDYTLDFPTKADAEIWYHKLLPFTQENTGTPVAMPACTTPAPGQSIFPLKYDPKNPLRPVIATDRTHVLAVKRDGTVLAADYWHNNTCYMGIEKWTNIVSVAAGYDFSVGLRADGTVVTTGNCKTGAVETLKNVISITAGMDFIATLHADGTVSAFVQSNGEFKRGGRNIGSCLSGVNEWSDIVSIARVPNSPMMFWGLTKRGEYNNAFGFGKHLSSIFRGFSTSDKTFPGLKRIKGISGMGKEPIILTQAGTVHCSKEGCAQLWTGIVDVDGYDHLVGLRANGTVVAVGPSNDNHKLDVSHWRNIIAIAAGKWWTMGLRADGHIEITYQSLFKGKNNKFAQEVRSWKLF